jgi:phosphatidylserine/phosphatidylglycerophosphate/cardiolipin synthase-like enzyme
VSLDELAARYLPPSTAQNPTYLRNSSFDAVIDGVDYFTDLHEAICAAGPGDSILLSGLQMEPDMDLRGLRAGDPDYRPIVDVLAEKAAVGADVRVLLSGAVLSGSLPWPKIGPFRANNAAARTMRGWLPRRGTPVAVPPLRDRVLLDWSGTGIGVNHQKVALLHIGGELTAFVGGIDLVASRFDAVPHARLRTSDNYRWRWHEVATLPRRYFYLPPASLAVLNPPLRPMTVPHAPEVRPVNGPDSAGSTDTAIQVLRSYGPWKVFYVRSLKRVRWTTLPRGGVQEVFHTLATAIKAAQRYIYLEDQYFYEAPGGNRRFGLYQLLREAADRGVKLILVGSGRKDPSDGGGMIKLQRKVTGDLERRILHRLPEAKRRNLVMHRIEGLTVHTKLILIDDVFACVGSANFFSRSMVGTDSEMSCATVTSGSTVRDLRVQLWAEHLRTPITDELRPALEDLDTAFGIWRPQWLPKGSAAGTWVQAGSPAGFAPLERVLFAVNP